jgi:iron(III) transport system ATP-binding protein
MTVFENVAFGLKLRKVASEELRRRVEAVLDVVRLGHLAARYPAELSGGQQQRVALARAIVVEPAVLLLDEPLSNLDANLREEMRVEIRRLHDAFGITTVYVTHDQSEAMATSDRIAVMSAGRIEQVAKPHELYMQPATRFVAGFIGRTNLIEAMVTTKEIGFAGISIARDRLGSAVSMPVGLAMLSVRPQGIFIRDAATDGAADKPMLHGTIAGATFLGETWDYVVALDGGDATLRVAAHPLAVHAIGETVVLELDPRQMALVP